MIERLKKLPKIELHLHLDGSLSLSLARQLSGLSIDEVKERMIAPDKCENLDEYLTRFSFPCRLMQTRESLMLLSKDLADRLAKQNILYAEVRFAPMLHNEKGLSYDEIVEAVLTGVQSHPNVKINLILCMMRGALKEDNLKTIETARKYLNKGVCALDLAGSDQYPIEDYYEFFDKAKAYHIPFTIHAGENSNADEVKKAIHCGASRIGHGIHAIDSKEVIELLKEKNILLEICPTSNVQTNSVDIYDNHPLKDLYQLAVPVCINTDDSTVSHISLSEEYIKLYHYFHFTIDDFKQMNINAIEGAFLNEKEKEEILQQYHQWFLDN